MKLEVVLRDRVYQVEVRESAGDGIHPAFEILLSRDGIADTYRVELLSRTGDRWTLGFGSTVEDFVLTVCDGKTFVNWKSQSDPVEVYSRKRKILNRAGGPDEMGRVALRAQMPGKVIDVLRQVGDLVQAGEGVVVIEAMKMQNEIGSPKSGTIIACDLHKGQSVSTGEVLFEIE